MKTIDDIKIDIGNSVSNPSKKTIDDIEKEIIQQQKINENDNILLRIEEKIDNILTLLKNYKE